MNYIPLYGMIAMVPRDHTDKLVPAIQKNAQVYLRHAVDKMRLPSTVEVNLEVCIGNPASVIVERAKALHVDAIVMSTHGRSGFGRWMFGSSIRDCENSAVIELVEFPLLWRFVPDQDRTPFKFSLLQAPHLLSKQLKN